MTSASPVSADLYSLSLFSGEMQECLRNCLDCTAVTRACAAACAGQPDMAECIQACLDCAATCTASVALMAQHSALHAAMCGVCADACERCHAACSQHDAEHCRACAAACERCMQSCRAMAQA